MSVARLTIPATEIMDAAQKYSVSFFFMAKITP